MNFSSDTAAPAHPAVLEALARVNHGPAPSYGDDRVMKQLRSLLVRTFETDELDFWITASGTASNALALSCFCPPTHSVICHAQAHIQVDERGAVEFFTGGGRLHLLPGKGAKVDYGQLADYLEAFDPRFVHETPPAVLSLTNLTECGMAYQPDEIAMRAERAKHFGLAVHLDGARLANALVFTGASPAEMSWKAGVDVLTLGLTKTGAVGCEIILFFGKAKEKGRELRARAKRAGHMPPKMRYLAAQAQALLDGGLWLALAAHANEKAQKLAAAFIADGHRLAWPVEGNEVFVHIDEHTLEKLREDGAAFYEWPTGSNRFVCSWATADAEIAALSESMTRSMRK
ncbi:threonine aldolase family protein [Hyphomonas sp.]|uniref:threonine aldolase family protein n=1 Tax=Hyphomonas sp. TaxID=87 RepID=UPI00391E0368